jgi:hypothetical protein
VNINERALHLEARVQHRWLWGLLLGSRPRIRGHRVDGRDEAIRWGDNVVLVSVSAGETIALTVYTTTMFKKGCNVATMSIDASLLEQGKSLKYSASFAPAIWDDPGAGMLTLHNNDES